MNSVYTSEVIQALREGDSEALMSLSPYAACMLPIVSVLEQKISVFEIASALPHYSFIFDLSALRSIFARLGFPSEKYRQDINTLDPECMPCLYINEAKQVCVIYKKEGDKFIYFNASIGQTEFEAIEDVGDVYVLLRNNVDKVKSRVKKSWFRSVMGRFNRLVKSVFLISFMLNVTTLTVPLFIMIIYDFVIGKQNVSMLPMLLLAMIIILVGDVGLRVIRSRLLAILAGRLEYILSTETLRQLLQLPASMTERSSAAAQISKLRLYDSIRECVSGPTALLFLELPFIPIFLFVIFMLGGSIVWVPIVAIAVLVVLGRSLLPRLKSYIALTSETRIERERQWLETLSGLIEIKCMADIGHWIRRGREKTKNALDMSFKASRLQILASTLTQGISMFAALGVVAIGGQQAIANEISIGALIAIMALLWRVIAPLQNLFSAFAKLDQLFHGIRSLDELMSLKPERNFSSSSLLQSEFKGGIKIERVSFRYAANLDPVLLGVNLDIAPKSFIVLTGENGSGKSTLLKLLCGLYHAQIGNILIDDTDVRQLNTNELRHVVAYMPQHIRFFHGDIAHNLRLGNLLATDEELREAANISGVLDEIESLPKGFETRIGDQATDGLSASAKRSLSIARALVRQSPILLFDEPGAALDKTGREQLKREFKKIKGEKTIIVVSSLPELITLADQVLVMRRGLIESNSTPDNFLKNIYGESA